ncbi:hypothetical protein ABZV77_42295 [Streptomyces sp. NPDC004732]|uniref:hypothetical protein n=1 Tax=Streptomyces sp. NPDC004732 TaxID=3154290 RepID=UPI0033AF663E
MSATSIPDGPGTGPAVPARALARHEHTPILFLLTDVGGGRPAAGSPRRAW